MIFLMCNEYIFCIILTILVYYIRVYVTHNIPLEIPREGMPRVIIRNIEERAKALTEHS